MDGENWLLIQRCLTHSLCFSPVCLYVTSLPLGFGLHLDTEFICDATPNTLLLPFSRVIKRVMLRFTFLFLFLAALFELMW